MPERLPPDAASREESRETEPRNNTEGACPRCCSECERFGPEVEVEADRGRMPERLPTTDTERRDSDSA